jgi:hypothetical protein
MGALRFSVGCPLIIRMIIQTIRLGPSGAVWTDAAPNVSRQDPARSIQSDAGFLARNRKVEGSNPFSGSKQQLRGHLWQCWRRSGNRRSFLWVGSPRRRRALPASLRRSGAYLPAGPGTDAGRRNAVRNVGARPSREVGPLTAFELRGSLTLGFDHRCRIRPGEVVAPLELISPQSPRSASYTSRRVTSGVLSTGNPGTHGMRCGQTVCDGRRLCRLHLFCGRRLKPTRAPRASTLLRSGT